MDQDSLCCYGELEIYNAVCITLYHISAMFAAIIATANRNSIHDGTFIIILLCHSCCDEAVILKMSS